MADVKASGVTANGESAQDLTDDANVLMLIQVPLKFRAPVFKAAASGPMVLGGGDLAKAAPSAAGKGASMNEQSRGRAQSDVDTAVLGHGPTEGKYTELDGLTIARDPRFPVRVTLQFYQATSNGVISRDDVKAQ
jgi:hypothetical protein